MMCTRPDRIEQGCRSGSPPRCLSPVRVICHPVSVPAGLSRSANAFTWSFVQLLGTQTCISHGLFVMTAASVLLTALSRGQFQPFLNPLLRDLRGLALREDDGRHEVGLEALVDSASFRGLPADEVGKGRQGQGWRAPPP